MAAFAFRRSWRPRVVRASALAAAGLPSRGDHGRGVEHPAALGRGLGRACARDLQTRARRGWQPEIVSYLK